MFAWQDGKMTKMRESEATHKGLTVIDLSNYWVPFIFSERNSDGEERIPNTYRSIFRKLANDWPYDPPSIAAAKKIWEEERERRRRAKMAALREEGKTEEEIRELLGDGAAEEEAPVAAAATRRWKRIPSTAAPVTPTTTWRCTAFRPPCPC